ncbi:MAG: DNA primase [Clostridia bacterium]|nr:DNA primase [Clostridia bacterium]
MAIPEEVILEIKYRNDIESVISPYVSLKRAGKNLKGLCPFHNEKTPSFTVYPENGSFYCFGCGVGGDIFTFTKTIENLDYIEAVKLLAERSGVTIPENGYDDSIQKLKKTILDINRETARFYNNYLMSSNGKWAYDYYTDRGLMPGTIKRFGLGAAPDSWDALLKYLKSLGFSEWEMEQANVISKSANTGRYYDRFRNRLMFPVINLRGNVIAFSGRARPGEEKSAKYINTSDTLVYKKSQNLFGINLAKNDCADNIILVEGNMDVISLHQAGFTNTVAPLGTAFTEEQARLLSRYTKEIIVTLDSDAAGQKAVMRALQTMKDINIPIRVLVLPECKDPDEYIKKHGAGRFRKLLEGATGEIEYRLIKAAEGIDLTGDEGRLKYLNAASELLASVDDAIAVDMYVGRLSEKYGVSKTALIHKIEEIRKKNIRSTYRKEIKEIVAPKFDKRDVNPERRNNVSAVAAEENFLAVLLQHPNLFETAYELLKPEQMVTNLNRKIYSVLINAMNSGKQVDISLFGEEFNASEMGYITMLQNSAKAEKNQKEVLKDCVAGILKQNILNASKQNRDMTNDEWLEHMRNIRNIKKENRE